MIRFLARWRVSLGFACAVAAFLLARPTWLSWQVGLIVGACGESLRVWAAGHLEKGREITRSGPYRFVRHPLYLGSATLALGFVIAAHQLVIGLLAAVYLGATLFAAIRSEEALLDRKFEGQYAAYRAGLAAPVERPFSWARAAANHEYRAVLGFVAAFALLALLI
jgi:protein-S-isoprenylcysteine O-methyltransferase Ste14